MKVENSKIPDIALNLLYFWFLSEAKKNHQGSRLVPICSFPGSFSHPNGLYGYVSKMTSVNLHRRLGIIPVIRSLLHITA